MTSKALAQKIINKIEQGHYVKNEKLPSENQFVIKYGVSRTLVSRAFEILKQTGAIYSIPKKGYFVAEFFSGLVQSVAFFVKASHWEDQKVSIKIPEFIKAKTKLANVKTISCLKRTYFKDRQKIAIAYNWYDFQKFNITSQKPIIDTLLDQGILKSSISNYVFENENEFTNSLNIINYQINYSYDAVVHAAKIIVKPPYFYLVKQEVVL